MASKALAEALADRGPHVDVRLVDAIASSSILFRMFYVWPYWLMIRWAPFLWARLYHARHTRRHAHTAPEWFFRLACRKVFAEMAKWNPEMIIATEVGACELGALAKQRGWTTATVFAVATDYEFEPVWVKDEVNKYFVPTVAVADQLISWGVSREKIEISGIPLLKKFRTPETRGEFKSRLGLATGRPVVLVMAGGMGPLRSDEIVQSLYRIPGPLSIVAFSGRDVRMRKRLEKLSRNSPPEKSLQVLGWTDETDAFMRAADVLVTKPGGLTLTEAACTGVPMVCVNPIPGPEEVHAELVCREGLGVRVKSIEEVAGAVTNFLKAPRRTTPPEWLKADAADRIADRAWSYVSLQWPGPATESERLKDSTVPARGTAAQIFQHQKREQLF
ncbi:MAG: glycosyltransferase [Acidobacteriia bacterium]|nr:glycosyltransferase [Terriglobia bacterium]